MNLLNFLRTKLVQEPSTVGKDQIQAALTSAPQADLLRRVGVISSDLKKLIQNESLVNYERSNLYLTIDRSLEHPLMSAAASLYADVATTRSSLQNSTVWVTAKSKEYKYQIEKMFDIINLEETIYDWAWSTATFGDQFVEIHGEPGVGIVSVNDDQHPINVSRVDYNGRLIGFFETPQGYSVADERKLLTPWSYVHFRLLGAKRRRPMYADANYSEYRTVNIMAPDIRRITSKYGNSVLADGLPIYKRLRLGEDSIMLARLTKGLTKYIYKIGVSGSNNEAIAQMIDQYVVELKRARSIDVDPNNPSYGDRANLMSAMEDIILPVWGDVGQLQIDKLDSSVDIKWIADLEEWRNQLATALKVPLALLSGYTKEGLPGGEGTSSIERMDIRFARQARRVQRSVINGLTRMAQIHLAYQGIDPDLNQFEIQMAETSSAEEEELKSGLDKGVDVVTKYVELLDNMFPNELERREVFDYLNKKFFKLNDFDLTKMLKKPNPNAFGGTEVPRETPVPGLETPVTTPPETEQENPFKESTSGGDFKGALPLKDASKLNESKAAWDKKYSATKVKITPIEEKKK